MYLTELINLMIRTIFYSLNYLLMFSSCIGFTPGIIWTWFNCALKTVGGTVMILLLLFRDKSLHVEHPDPKVKLRTIKALQAVAEKDFWTAGVLVLVLSFGLAATGHTWLALANAISFSVVLSVQVKASQAIQ
jgi:hypothetical protein